MQGRSKSFFRSPLLLITGKIKDMSNPTIQSEIETELQLAIQYNALNQEGKSRVCARRAAGSAILLWFKQKSIDQDGLTIYNALSHFKEMEEIPENVKEAASLLIQKVDENYRLPENIHLIEQAKTIIEFTKK